MPLYYFRQAADLGNAGGQVCCANMLLKGEGVAMNATEAVALYEGAARKGHVGALVNLAKARRQHSGATTRSFACI